MKVKVGFFSIFNSIVRDYVLPEIDSQFRYFDCTNHVDVFNLYCLVNHRGNTFGQAINSWTRENSQILSSEGDSHVSRDEQFVLFTMHTLTHLSPNLPINGFCNPVDFFTDCLVMRACFPEYCTLENEIYKELSTCVEMFMHIMLLRHYRHFQNHFQLMLFGYKLAFPTSAEKYFYQPVSVDISGLMTEQTATLEITSTSLSDMQFVADFDNQVDLEKYLHFIANCSLPEEVKKAFSHARLV
ncbi:MAG: hypothetical protein ACRCXZ_07670 [Patescibacteria group bacterium]